MDYELDAQQEPPLDGFERPTRILHTMLRVLDLQRSLDFYIGALGMKLLRRQDDPAGRLTLALLGCATQERLAPQIELAQQWDRTEPYAPGSAWGHIAMAVSDLYATCAELAEAGVCVSGAPRPLRHGGAPSAFIEDPDGHLIQLVQRQ